ncbi:MAG: chorismate mutase [Clostridia bacterium]|nr:chorismate mutase [Clostridia bacterium]
MESLNEIRVVIDKIDNDMAKLFKERMDAVKMVAEYKKEHGIPIEDKERENAMILKNTEKQPFDIQPYYKEFLKSMLSESKSYQSLLCSNMTVSYSGVEGAFAYIAAKRIFPTAKTISCPDFETAYNMVVTGKSNCAVLPIENSFAGDVEQVMDLAYFGELSVSGIFDLPLSHCLLANPGTKIEDIKAVQSHPQALSQCMPYLKKHGWNLIQASNTAIAAKDVAQSRRRDLAVVASKETAELYGLQVLESEINEQKTNTTRFAVFTREPVSVDPSDNHFVLMFKVKNEPGSLGNAIYIISKYNYNLMSLKSHPSGEDNWAYYFYSEGEGNLATESGKKMLEELKAVCNNVRIVGSFGKE